MKHAKHVIRFALALLLLAGCGDGNEPGAAGDSALRARIDALYEAEQAEDRKAWYEMTGIAKLGVMSYEEFQKEVGEGPRAGSLVSWSVKSIRPEKVKDDIADRVTRSVRVAMDVTIRRPDGTEEKVPEQTDQWVLIDGEWYWGWRGFPSD